MLNQTSFCLCLHGIEYPQRLYYNEKQSRFSCHCSKRDMSRRGTFQNFVNATFEENWIKALCKILVERNTNNCALLEAASWETSHSWEGKRQLCSCTGGGNIIKVCSWYAVDDGTDQAKSRFLGGAGKWYMTKRDAKQIPINLNLFSLAVPATELNNDLG